MNKINLKAKKLFPKMYNIGETFHGILTEKLENTCTINLSNGAFGKIYTKNYAKLPKLEVNQEIEVSLIGFASDGEMIFNFSPAYAKKFGIIVCNEKTGTIAAVSRRGAAVYFQDYDEVVLFECALPPYQPNDVVRCSVYEYPDHVIGLNILEVIDDKNSKMIETSSGELLLFDKDVFERAVRIGSAEEHMTYKLGFLYKAVIQYNEEDEKVEFADGVLALITKKEQLLPMGKTAWVRVINIDTKREYLRSTPLEVSVLCEV